MRHRFAQLSIFLFVVAGCRATSPQPLTEVAGSGDGQGPVHCEFPMPDGSGHKYEFWATPRGPVLVNVKDQMTDGRQNTKVQANRGTLEALSPSQVESMSRKGIRGYGKDFMTLRYDEFNCYRLTGLQSAQVGVICLDRRPNDGTEGLWVSNYSKQRYVNEYTVFRANCR